MKIVKIFFWFIAITLVIINALLLATTNFLENKCTKVTKGTVTDVEKIEKDDTTSYTIIYTIDGKEYNLKKEIKYKSYARGDTLIINYDPTKPSRSYLKEEMENNNNHEMSKARTLLSFILPFILPIGFTIFIKFIPLKK